MCIMITPGAQMKCIMKYQASVLWVDKVSARKFQRYVIIFGKLHEEGKIGSKLM